MRFSRNYKLTINDVVIEPPMRIAFSAVKSVGGAGLNKLTLKVYNLKESNRLALVRDADGWTIGSKDHIPVELQVGYQDSLQTVFKGSVHEGSNDRAGADFISTIECIDGSFDLLNSFTSRTVRGGETVVNAILEDMPNTTKGKITSRPSITRPRVLVGNSYYLLRDSLADGEQIYINNEQLYIVKDNEVVSDFIPVISAETGLINTPKRKNKQVTIDTLMNPSIVPGGLLELTSTSAPYLNDIYKAWSIVYSGDTEGADWNQSVVCRVAEGYTVL